MNSELAREIAHGDLLGETIVEKTIRLVSPRESEALTALKRFAEQLIDESLQNERTGRAKLVAQLAQQRRSPLDRRIAGRNQLGVDLHDEAAHSAMNEMIHVPLTGGAKDDVARSDVRGTLRRRVAEGACADEAENR